MSNSNKDDMIRGIINSLYKPVTASLEFKKQLLDRLTHEVQERVTAWPEESQLQPIQIQNVAVVVYMESQILTGSISLPGNSRLSDFLNGITDNSLNISMRFLEMTDVTISYADGKQEKAKIVYVNIEAIQMLRTLDKDAARGKGATNIQKAYPFVKKSSVQTKMHIFNYELNGYLHCRNVEGFAQLLTQREPFIPCTDARLHNIHEDTWFDAGFVAINKRQVDSLQRID